MSMVSVPVSIGAISKLKLINVWAALVGAMSISFKASFVEHVMVDEVSVPA
jgi:hypothetical protein